ncbi:MAG TPA: tetratricopeptide repeat protein [Planctomycetaceae bacterium]|nr:tetratricopeptide repeat protein [Planctomycetaceae bacterium]
MLIVSIGAAVVIWVSGRPGRIYAAGRQALAQNDLNGVRTAAARLGRYREWQAEAGLLHGAYQLRVGNPAGALASLQPAADSPRTERDAQLLVGEAHCRLHQYHAALPWLNACIHHDAANVEAYRWLGIAYYDLGAMGYALGALEKYAELAPDDYRPHRLMGVIHQDEEHYQEALADYESALRLNPGPPDLPEIQLETARLQVKLHRYAAARETLSAPDNNPEALVLRAECDAADGQVEAARRSVQEALRLAPQHAEALALKGTLELEQGSPEAALGPLQRASQLVPDDLSLHFKLAQAYAQLGKTAEAEFHQGRRTEIKQLREEFSSVFQQVTQDADDVESRFRLGVLARRLQRTELARMWFEAALAINPDYAPARRALSDLPSPRTPSRSTAALATP